MLHNIFIIITLNILPSSFSRMSMQISRVLSWTISRFMPVVYFYRCSLDLWKTFQSQTLDQDNKMDVHFARNVLVDTAKWAYMVFWWRNHNLSFHYYFGTFFFNSSTEVSKTPKKTIIYEKKDASSAKSLEMLRRNCLSR